MKLKKISLSLLFLAVLSFFVSGQNMKLSEIAEISILTCSPGIEAYSVYGHSAIRVKDEMYDYDVVFNYGIFDFSTPNFLYRFASGQTDYLLGAYRYESFYQEYFREKRSIYEQVLNLTQVEKQKIFDFLLWNAQPENRVYRYNFFFDNCATRVRDVLEEQVEGTVVFPPDRETGKTYRDLIKEYHAEMLWLNFGIDLVVSAPSDKIAPVYDEMFLPDYLMEHFANASIKTVTGEKSLVKDSNVLYQSPGLEIKSAKIVSPFVVFGILFLLVAFLSVKQFRKNKITYLLDYLVFGITGFMGIIMLWFVVYSEHPAMNPNYNLFWAVPLHLVFAILWKVKKWRPVTRYYFVAISVWMLLFLFFGTFLPQQFHIAFYFFVLIVLSRSLLHTVFVFKKMELR